MRKIAAYAAIGAGVGLSIATSPQVLPSRQTAEQGGTVALVAGERQTATVRVDGECSGEDLDGLPMTAWLVVRTDWAGDGDTGESDDSSTTILPCDPDSEVCEWPGDSATSDAGLAVEAFEDCTSTRCTETFTLTFESLTDGTLDWEATAYGDFDLADVDACSLTLTVE